MKVLFASDRECTIDGVGLLVPGEPVEVDPEVFKLVHGITPAQANFPTFIKVTYVLPEREKEEGGE